VKERDAGLVRRVRDIWRLREDPVEAVVARGRVHVPDADLEAELVELRVRARELRGTLAHVRRDDAIGAALRGDERERPGSRAEVEHGDADRRRHRADEVDRRRARRHHRIRAGGHVVRPDEDVLDHREPEVRAREPVREADDAGRLERAEGARAERALGIGFMYRDEMLE
jgi:hypothetical protein